MKFCVIILTTLALILFPGTMIAEELIVDVKGLDNDEQQNVLLSLSIAQLLQDRTALDLLTRRESSPLTQRDVDRLPRLHKAANQEIRTALQPFGYYRPTIDAQLVQNGEVWTASYTVDVGDPVLISDVDIKIDGAGQSEPIIKKALQSRPFKVGQRLNHQTYTSFKNTLLSRVNELGYLDARYSINRLLVDPKKDAAVIKWTLSTGEQYYFGKITFDQDVIDDELLNRFVPFRTGDVYSNSQLISTQLALDDSQYFDRVEITVDSTQATEQKIPVLIKAVPSRPRQHTIGFGYGTDTGFRSHFGTIFKRVNSRGHRIQTDLLFSQVKQSIAANYEIPLGATSGDTLRFLSRYENEDVGDGKAERFSLGSSYHDTWHNLQRRLYVNYTLETSTFGEDSSSARFLTPGGTLSFTKADNILFPKTGYSWLIDLHGASSMLVSDASFMQGRVVGQGVWSPAEKWRVLTKLQFGANKIDDVENLPTSSRFFAGGDSSVRGYRYQSLGSLNEDGNNIGGKYLATISLEADYLAFNNFGGAVFVDAGDAAKTTDFNWHIGVGAGLRWRSPVGMFRLDVAVPLDENESPYRLHLSIGADL